MRKIVPLLVLIVLACLAALAQTASATVLAGDQTIEASPDFNPSGVAQAFKYTASASGSTTDAQIYIGTSNGATTLKVGVYSNNASNKPGTLLASGSKASPTSSAWNSVTLSSASLSSGTVYWIAILGTGGALKYRDVGSGSPTSYDSGTTTISSLPTTYPTGTGYLSGNLSGYVNGTAGSAPTNTVLPAVSGTDTQGQTLSTTNGTWTGSPTSYSYQWRDCDSAGNTCSNISGATSSSYTLVNADAGHTVRAVVTATNSSGSTPATSAQTGVVVALPPANTAVPTISGSTTQGSVRTGSQGTWTNGPTSYSYQWQRCGGSCTNISGATAQTYTLAAADVNDTVDVVETATNSGGSASATSTQTATVTLGCNVNSTTSSFASDVTNATAGQTLCLASGNYGTWTGTNKAITVTRQVGADPTMLINFGSGASGFTLDHMDAMGGVIDGPASNVTVQNSTFTSSLKVAWNTGTGLSGIDIKGNTFNWSAVFDGSINAKIAVNETLTQTTGTLASPSVTIENNDIENGNLDGVHLGGGAGMIVRNNAFRNLCDTGTNHTDNIQFEGGSATDVVGNYIDTPGPVSTTGCDAGGITSYDGGTNGVIIENNVLDVTRDWSIELYADTNSIVRHNTLIWHPTTYSAFGSEDGQIDIDHKTGQSCGSGTHAYDNVATSVNLVCPGTADHNVSGQTAIYQGGSLVHDSSLLASNSPVGLAAADDGSDDGIFAASW